MLQQWLSDRCVPLVATLVTEDADLTCRKNGLNFEQLVSAFCRLDGLKVPFRSASHSYSLDSFALRFVRGSSMRPALAREADAALSNVTVLAAANAAKNAAQRKAGSADTTSAAAAGEALLESSVENQDWYKRFRVRLWEGLCHQEYDMLDCPAAVLVVVSSTEASGDPVACFDELASPRYLPPPFQSRQYDPQSPALVYVLLHDWCRGTAQGVDPDVVLSQMQGTFTAGQCRMLCVNSLPPESPNLSQPDIWTEACQADNLLSRAGRSAIRGDSGGVVRDWTSGGAGGVAGGNNVRGRCLSPEDLLAVRDFVRGLASQVVVPSMERRILTLNATISSERKGVRNVIKSWWRKPREVGVDPVTGGDAGGGAGGGAMYRFDRSASQVRLLADSAFLMRDFETAASMYRMARDDFKSDRAVLHYAAASEMLAISLHLLSGRAAAALSSSSGANSPGGVVSPQAPNSYGSNFSSGGGLMTSLGVTGGLVAGASGSAAAAGGGAGGVGGFGIGPGGSGGGGGDLSAWQGSPTSGGGSQASITTATTIAASAPTSGSGMGHSTSTLLGRGREADAAFALALDAYQRRAAEDSAALGAGYGSSGGGSLGGGGGSRGGMVTPVPAARLAARAALLYADVAATAAASSEATIGVMMTSTRSSGDGRGLGADTTELQAEAEEALLQASVQETPLCAAVLLEVSANRCRAARRLRRASFRLVQAGHMYKTFAAERAERLRRERQQQQHQQQQQQEGGGEAAGAAVVVENDDKSTFLGMHAARCFLAALAGYQGSGWLAAEEYTSTVLPTELRTLQRPVAALQLYVRLLAARGDRTGNLSVGGGNGSGVLAQSQLQQTQHKRAGREAALLRVFADLCGRYPEAARVAARAWERGRGTSKLDMTFFPLTDATEVGTTGTPPLPPPSPADASMTADLLDLKQFYDKETAGDADGDTDADTESSTGGDGGADIGDASRGGLGQDSDQGGADGGHADEGVVFHGLALPAVVHEETRAVDTENASVKASVEVSGNAAWASEMAEALRAELAAAEAVQAGEGPWLTVTASFAHQAGRDPTSTSYPRKPSHLPPPPRHAPVGEPVTVLIVLENRLSVAVAVEDLQLVLAAGESLALGEGEKVQVMAVDEDKFAEMYAQNPPSPNIGDAFRVSPPSPAAGTAAAAVERRRATVAPGARLPVLLKFCALQPSVPTWTVSAVRWTILQRYRRSGEGEGKEGEGREGTGMVGPRPPRVWVSHRLEGKGELLHNTLEQRAARARAPAPPPRFDATGPMPWLGCSLEGVPPTLLQGEAVRATLKMCNRGRAAAGELCIKTNLPWVAFGDAEAVDASNSGRGEGAGAAAAAATGGAVGASGTTLLPPVGVIAPGETVRLPVWVRGRGGGRQTVKMLVRYKRAHGPGEEGDAEGQAGESADLPGSEPGAGAASTLFKLERYAPVSVEMCVLPSLSVAASVLPSYSRRGEYVLSLEATNYRSNGEDDGWGNGHLRIHKVCAISRCWRMEPLAGFSPPAAAAEGADKGGGGGGGGGGTVVEWQERITLHYRLFPVDIVAPAAAENSGSEGSAGQDALPVRHNDCPLGEERRHGAQEGSADSPYLPLLCLEQAASNYYAACRKHRQQKLAEAAEAAADEHPRTIQGVRRGRDRERASEILKKEEEEEDRRWRTQGRAHPTSPEALCTPNVSLVHLMVIWGLDGSGNSPARRGQHHVRSLVIRPERVDRQCPLVLTVKYPSEIHWDEKKASVSVSSGVASSGGCDAEVTVCATNRLAGPGDDAKVNFTFEVRPDDGPRRLSTVSGALSQTSGGAQGSGSSKRPPRNRFVWLGPTRRRVIGLGPGEAITIPLKVRFFRPGVFDLNRFRFVVEFAPPSPSLKVPNPSSHPHQQGSQSQQSSTMQASPQKHQQQQQQQQHQQQQQRTPSAQQQGRVTFVFPAQYLITVSPDTAAVLRPGDAGKAGVRTGLDTSNVFAGGSSATSRDVIGSAFVGISSSSSSAGATAAAGVVVG